MAKYAVTLKRTLDTLKSVGTINAPSSSARRGFLYYWSIGSESAPGDNNIEIQIARCTSAGTTGSTVTPVMLDSADPATTATAAQAHTSTNDPLPTSTSDLFREAFNQKYGAKWYAPPGGELVYPASASNGFVIRTPVCSSGTPLITAEFHVEER